MRFHLRINTSELDLIALASNPNIRFSSAVKSILTEYVRFGTCGQTGRLSAPAQPMLIVKERNFIISLDDTEDADIIRWLASIQKGHQGSVVKLLIRAASDHQMWMYKNNVQLIIANTRSPQSTSRTEVIQPAPADPPTPTQEPKAPPIVQSEPPLAIQATTVKTVVLQEAEQPTVQEAEPPNVENTELPPTQMPQDSFEETQEETSLFDPIAETTSTPTYEPPTNAEPPVEPEAPPVVDAEPNALFPVIESVLVGATPVSRAKPLSPTADAPSPVSKTSVAPPPISSTAEAPPSITQTAPTTNPAPPHPSTQPTQPTSPANELRRVRGLRFR